MVELLAVELFYVKFDEVLLVLFVVGFVVEFVVLLVVELVLVEFVVVLPVFI